MESNLSFKEEYQGFNYVVIKLETTAEVQNPFEVHESSKVLLSKSYGFYETVLLPQGDQFLPATVIAKFKYLQEGERFAKEHNVCHSLPEPGNSAVCEEYFVVKYLLPVPNCTGYAPSTTSKLQKKLDGTLLSKHNRVYYPCKIVHTTSSSRQAYRKSKELNLSNQIYLSPAKELALSRSDRYNKRFSSDILRGKLGNNHLLERLGDFQQSNRLIEETVLRVEPEGLVKTFRSRRKVRNTEKQLKASSNCKGLNPSLPPLTAGQPNTKRNTSYISLSNEDFMSLGPGKLVNDNIINAFLFLMVGENADEYFCFNTKFIHHLMDSNRIVETYYRKEKIFTRRHFMIPVHFRELRHWAFIIVDNLKGKIVYFDSLSDNFRARFRRGKPILEILLAYLKHRRELENLQNSEYRTMLFNDVTFIQPPTSNDCGVYVCSFIYNMVQRRNKNKRVMLNRSDVKGLLKGMVTE